MISTEVKISHSFWMGTIGNLHLSVTQLFWTLSTAKQKIQFCLQSTLINTERPMKLCLTLKIPYTALTVLNFTVN